MNQKQCLCEREVLKVGGRVCLGPVLRRVVSLARLSKEQQTLELLCWGVTSLVVAPLESVTRDPVEMGR